MTGKRSRKIKREKKTCGEIKGGQGGKKRRREKSLGDIKVAPSFKNRFVEIKNFRQIKSIRASQGGGTTPPTAKKSPTGVINSWQEVAKRNWFE